MTERFFDKLDGFKRSRWFVVAEIRRPLNTWNWKQCTSFILLEETTKMIKELFIYRNCKYRERDVSCFFSFKALFLFIKLSSTSASCPFIKSISFFHDAVYLCCSLTECCISSTVCFSLSRLSMILLIDTWDPLNFHHFHLQCSNGIILFFPLNFLFFLPLPCSFTAASIAVSNSLIVSSWYLLAADNFLAVVSSKFTICF